MTADQHDSAIDEQLRHASASLPRPADTGHLSEEDWVRFASGEMTSNERSAVADHVVSCTECATIFRVVSLVGDAGRGTVSDGAAFGGWRLLAAAAALALALGLGTWLMTRTVNTGDVARVAGEPPANGATPAVSDPAAQFPAWAAALPPAPEVRLPPDLFLTMRGVDADRDAFLTAFGEAITPYRAGRFADAAASLAPLAERHADVAEVWFYLGASRLYAGAAAEAIDPLERARGSGVVGDDARWLQALALGRAGRVDEARSSLQAICSAPGQYREQACTALRP